MLPDISMEGQEETTISAEQLEEVLKSVQGWAVLLHGGDDEHSNSHPKHGRLVIL